MLIPEAWDGHKTMSDEKKAFYEYHSCLMEPWDGPARWSSPTGTSIGAVLDRNGLRPSRYYVPKDGMVVMASEVGVLDVAPKDIVHERPSSARQDVSHRHARRPHHRRRGTEAEDRVREAVPAMAQRKHDPASRTCPRAGSFPSPITETVLLRQQIVRLHARRSARS